MASLTTSESYRKLFIEVKQKIQEAQHKAMVTVNQQLLQLYWQIGHLILQRQEEEGWGKKVIPQLVKDLKNDLPNAKGFSESNLEYMRQFAAAYTFAEISQAPLGEISWYHNVTLFHKCTSKSERLWYASKAVENGWSRNTMLIHIERKIYEREGKAITNFTETLPKTQSDLAQQTLKDPYIFDFLGLTENVLERELEDALTSHIIKFLLELGQGFAFVGRQYVLNVSNEDFKIDLLFYHLKLRCYVVVDLKMRKFKPEDAGKMNFYINATDDLVRGEYDNPTIGIILCKDKDNVKAEYALRGITTPIGISEFRLTETLPKEFESQLPSIEDLEQKLKDIE